MALAWCLNSTTPDLDISRVVFRAMIPPLLPPPRSEVGFFSTDDTLGLSRRKYLPLRLLC